MRSARGPQPYGRLDSRVEVNQWWSSRVKQRQFRGIVDMLRHERSLAQLRFCWNCDWIVASCSSSIYSSEAFRVLVDPSIDTSNRNLSRDHDATFAFHRSGKAIADPGDADLWVILKLPGQWTRLTVAQAMWFGTFSGRCSGVEHRLVARPRV